MHSVLLGLPEGSGGCVGHWPGWDSTLSPGPAARKLLRSSENEVWCRKADPCGALNKFHLNVSPGGGNKGNWSQPGGRKIPRGAFLKQLRFFV